MYNVNGWKDQLSRIEILGEAPCDSGNCNCNCNCVNTLTEYFSYNTLGYPTVYRGKYLTWDRVNKLTRFDGNTFTYDSAGMRLTKNTNTQYTYDGDKLIREVRNGKVIEYIYGLSGIIGFVYDGTPYYYIKDIQGNVKRITNIYGHVVASYSYDTWGNHIVYDEYGDVNTYYGTIGNINPIRYRSYYYDTETGHYLIQGRYYDPEIGRFIEPASVLNLNPSTINGLNLYLYSLCKIKTVPSIGDVMDYTASSIATNSNNIHSEFISLRVFLNICRTLNVVLSATDTVEFSLLSGGTDGILDFFGGTNGFNCKTLQPIKGFWGKLKLRLTIVNTALEIGTVTYENFNNSEYNLLQKYVATQMDIQCAISKGVITYALGSEVARLAASAGFAIGNAIALKASLSAAIAIGGGVAILIGIVGAAIIYGGCVLLDRINESKKEQLIDFLG